MGIQFGHGIFIQWHFLDFTLGKVYHFQLKRDQIKVPLSTGILTHWGRVTHICVGKLTNLGSDNGLSPGRRQAIIWTNAGISLIGPLGTNFSEILIGIQTYSFKKMHLKMSSAKWRPFCLGLNEFIGSLAPTREYLEQCTNDDIYSCHQEIRSNRYMIQSLRRCFFVPQYSPVQQNQKTIPVLRKKKPNELKSWHWHQLIRESNSRLGTRAICMLSGFSHINNENSIMGSVATSFSSFSKILTMDVPWLAPVWARYDVSFVSLQYYIPVNFFNCCDGYNVR